MAADRNTKTTRIRVRRKAPRVSIIIPVFNQAALTADCLQSLAGHAADEIVVVDDASTDSTPQLLGQPGARIRVLRHETNAGFAQSCNDGAAAATARDFLVFLNNDTLPQPGWLDALVRHANAHPEAGVIGGKLLYPNHTIQHAGVVVCQDHYPRHIYTGFPANHPAVNRSRPFQIVTAACMLIRREIFERARGFDTAFRNGFEDVDLCLRLGEQGVQIHYCADSIVCHLESVSPGRFQHDRENTDLYRQRWLKRVQPDDVTYYLEDELLRIRYEGRYPAHIEVSPRLATIDRADRSRKLEDLLREKNRALSDLQRENTRLRLELGARTGASPELDYRRLRERIRATIRKLTPAGATVLVISKGDGALLKFPGRRGWHFPQAENGAYAGHHPAGSAEAIAHLEFLRARGANYLLIPATAKWWLDYYKEFHQHLDAHYQPLGTGDSCLVYALKTSSSKSIKNA